MALEAPVLIGFTTGIEQQGVAGTLKAVCLLEYEMIPKIVGHSLAEVMFDAHPHARHTV